MKIRFISLANRNYFDMLYCCIKSCLYHYPDAVFEAVLVNMEETDRQKIEGISPRVTCCLEQVEFSNTQQVRCYCTNRRNFLLRKCKKEGEVCIWIDADTIVRQYSEEWVQMMSGEYDLICYGGGRYTLGGIIVVCDTPKAELFLRLYDEAYPQESYKRAKERDRNMGTWMLNQSCLRNIVKGGHGIKVQHVSMPFINSKLYDDAYIWTPIHAKSSPKFQEELSRYRELTIGK